MGGKGILSRLLTDDFYVRIDTIRHTTDQRVCQTAGHRQKSAERLAYHMLRIHRTEALALAEAIRSVKENVQYCRKCYNLAEGEECTICRDAGRQQDVLCVVEQPRDLMALEQAGVYRGLYHVLLGRMAPLEGIGPDQLTIDALVRRVREGGFKELIMATNPTVEGDGTALHISNLLGDLPIRDYAACTRNHQRERAGVCEQGNPGRRVDRSAGSFRGESVGGAVVRFLA